MTTDERYIPALGFRTLTPLYDGVLRWLFRERALKRALTAELGLAPGQRALDLGCGSGSLLLLLKEAGPGAHVVGVDGDVDILRIAHRKARRSGTPLALTQGLAQALPFADRSFDRVASSLMFHHLARPAKQRAIEETARVLRQDGVFYLLDFGPPASRTAAVLARAVRHVEEVADNLEGALPGLLRAAGFADVTVRGRWMTVLGTVVLYRAAATAG